MKEIEPMIYIFTNTVSEPAKVAIETAHNFDWTMLIQPTATLTTGILAIIAVIWSQRKLDDRQRKDHFQEITLKNSEILLEKTHDLILLSNKQTALLISINQKLKSTRLKSVEAINEFKLQQSQIVTNHNMFAILKRMHFNHLTEEYKQLICQMSEFSKEFKKFRDSGYIYLDDTDFYDKSINLSKAYISFIDQIIKDNRLKQTPFS